MATVITIGKAGWCNQCGSEMRFDDQGRKYCSDQDAPTCIEPEPDATREGKKIHPYRRR